MSRPPILPRRPMMLLKSLVRFVEKDGTFETHDDIPDSLREQLYAKDNKRTIKQRAHTNILPRIIHTDLIDIPGLHNVAVAVYSDWQQSRVSSEALKDEIRKAWDLMLKNRLDLKQIHGDQDLDFFIKHT
ncbi:hypothetical protein N7540_009508 [Penicillium herquei]|nr:hypothetical protein N7540_009508 [Penicillium herquei]